MAQQMAVRSNDAAETGRLVVERTAAERRLVGEEKAAALLLALGPEITRPVFKQLDDSEIRQLSHAMVRIGSITQRMLDELLVDFVSRVTSSGSLSGNPESTKEFFFANMSARAARMLREDMDSTGPVRLRDVDEAQTTLLNTAKDMAVRGEIVITKNRGDDEMII